MVQDIKNQHDSDINDKIEKSFLEMEELDEAWMQEMQADMDLQREYDKKFDELNADFKEGKISTEEFSTKHQQLLKEWKEKGIVLNQKIDEISKKEDEEFQRFKKHSDEALAELDKFSSKFDDQIKKCNNVNECADIMIADINITMVLKETKYKALLDEVYKEVFPEELCVDTNTKEEEAKIADEYSKYMAKLTDDYTNPEKYKKFSQQVLDTFINKIRKAEPDLADSYSEFITILASKKETVYELDRRLNACLRRINRNKFSCLLYVFYKPLHWFVSQKFMPKKVKSASVRRGLWDKLSQLSCLFDEMTKENADEILKTLHQIY